MPTKTPTGLMTNISRYKRTRIAPTPSGFLHIGNILSFAITASLARKHNAKILLRIDDLDRARVNTEYLQDIFETLNFLGIPWDEGPRTVKEFKDSYSQLHRVAIYDEALQQLAHDGFVFACLCSRRQLQSAGSCACVDRKIPITAANASWRLITDHKTGIEVKDYSGQLIREVLPADMYNFIVKKKDGFPAYQLASVIDDLYYNVDLVVRGKDLWSSTLAQLQLSALLNKNSFGDITFHHHPLLMATQGQKLSKSAGAASIRYLRESGKTAADIYQLIAAKLSINEQIENWHQLAEACLFLRQKF